MMYSGASVVQVPLTRRAALRASGALAGVAALVAAACQRPQAPAGGDATRSTAPKAPVTVRFNTWWTAMEPFLEWTVKTFEEENPGIKVEAQMLTGDWTAKLQAGLVAGVWDDVAQTNNTIQAKFMDSGAHLDLTDRHKRDKIDIRQTHLLMGIEIWCGKVYNVPWDNDPRAVYYNKTLIKQAGEKDPWEDLKGKWTWDDMFRIAKAVTKDTDGDGRIDQWGMQWAYHSYQEFPVFTWTMGGNYADWQNMKYILDSREVIATQELLYRWAIQEKVLMTNQQISELSQAGITIPFASGKVAFWFRAAASMVPMVRNISNRFEWDIAPMPDMDPGHPGISVTSGNPYFIPSFTKVPDEAYKLIMWLAGPRYQKEMAKQKVFFPSLKAALADYVVGPPDHADTFAKVYERPYGIHFRHYETVQAGNVIAEEINKAFAGEKGVPQALKDANQRANELVRYGQCNPYQGIRVPIPGSPLPLGR